MIFGSGPQDKSFPYRKAFCIFDWIACRACGIIIQKYDKICGHTGRDLRGNAESEMGENI